jgi:exodeoxyribonuclease (lambda-induced)
MAHLQQRTPAWHAARKNKLTASNLGGLLGLCSWCSRQQTYDRLTGKSTFEGNEATQWGNDNEQNAINDYQTLTGTLVDPSGLHVHSSYMWLAGSPDGLVGEDGMVEIKCPFYRKVAHEKIPMHYYIQIQSLLEILGRKWCDFVSWSPNGFKVYRVTADKTLFDFCLPYWGHVHSCLQRNVHQLPAFKAGVKARIVERVEESMAAFIDYDINSLCEDPPCGSDSEASFDEGFVDLSYYLSTGQKEVVEPFAKRLKSEL